MKKILLITLFSLGVLMEMKVNAQTDIIFYTTMGTFEVELYDTLQPITTGNFISLVEEEFYDGIIFHRVVEDFVIQGGDPYGTGFGGPGYTIEDEFDTLTSNVQKALGMANSGPNTGGSQFYINMVDNIYLDPNYPVFGIVTDSFEVVQAISEVPVNAADKPLTPVVMDSVRIKGAEPTTIQNNTADLFDITISPNPASDFINLSGSNFEGNYTLTLINNSGITFFEDKLTPTIQIPVSGLIAGSYFIVVKDESGKFVGVRKVMVQK
jgi:cyclophilin family peptidyl-prolyl cis-trans isomerase